jgi:hypothetical protein
MALARDALTDPITVMIAAVSLVVLLTTILDTLWLILGAAAVSLSASSLGILIGGQELLADDRSDRPEGAGNGDRS